MIYYETRGHNHKKDGSKKAWVYRTKSRTPHHAKLMEAYGGTLLEADTSVSWPFGDYAEVIDEKDCPVCGPRKFH